MSDRTILKIKDVSLRFGGITALDNVSLEVKRGEMLAIIGPNGAGKTSFLNVINGFNRPQKGEIWYRGKNLVKMPSYQIAKMGISRTFQNIALYTGLSTIDNMLAGRHLFFKSNFLEGAIFWGRCQREEVKHRKVCEEIIDLLELQEKRNQVVATLSYGWRKRVELARAMALEPEIVLLDEPMAGLSRTGKEDMVRLIDDIRSLRGTTCILIEHDMEVVMDISDRVVALDFGRLIAEGTPEEIKTDPRVIDAYLGKGIGEVVYQPAAQEMKT